MGNIRNFVHLHNHTEYSYFDGMLRIGEMLDETEKMNMQALAITDHGNMFGCIKFYKSCLERGIKPIIGCEVYIAKYSRFSKKKGIDENPFHLVLLVKDFKGYQNLMTLVSLGYLEGFFNYPRIDKEILSKHSDGLIALSSCLNGEIPNLILEGKIEKACETASEYNEIFGRGNFYLELMKHGIEQEVLINETDKFQKTIDNQGIKI